MKKLDEQGFTNLDSIINRTKALLDSRILWNSATIYKNSVLIEVLINVSDLLFKADELNDRIDFTDDITTKDNFKIKDITDLIKKFRDASCHNHSFRRKSGLSSASFCEVGPSCIFGYLDGVKLENKYSDDIAFIMGANTLYLKRHIERSFYESVQVFNQHGVY